MRDQPRRYRNGEQVGRDFTKERECEKDECDFSCYSQLGMDYHVLRDHPRG